MLVLGVARLAFVAPLPIHVLLIRMIGATLSTEWVTTWLDVVVIAFGTSTVPSDVSNFSAVVTGSRFSASSGVPVIVVVGVVVTAVIVVIVVVVVPTTILTPCGTIRR